MMPERFLRPYLLFLSILFVAACLGGTLAPWPMRKQAAELFLAALEQFEGASGGTLFFYILLQNVTVSLLVVGAGLLFGIIPILAICSHGFMLGVVWRASAETVGHAKTALSVLPHGVVEIPALLIAASYGLWLGVMAIRRIRGKEETLLRFQIEHAFRRYFAVVFPLLIIAAAIETFLILKVR